MSRILRRSGLRYLGRHPWQIGLATLGVALGVAVVVSIDLANQSAMRAFGLSTEAVSGRATHQVLGGPSGLPDSVYRDLRLGLGLRQSAPVVEGDVPSPSHPGRAFRVLGVDPFAERPFRPLLDPGAGGVDLGVLLTRPGAVVLSATTAAELGLAPGDPLDVRVGVELRRLEVVGLLEPADRAGRQALENLVVADIATAQEVLGSVGRLSRIDLIVPAGSAGDAMLAAVVGALPAGATVVSAAARAGAIEQMTGAFQLNLSALSLLALVFGMFLIYNSMTFSVVQRRPLIGMLRALGVTRREVFGLVLVEALAVGIVGTAVGLAAGIGLGRGLVGLVTRTINDLYFVLSVRELAIPPLVLLKGVGMGLGATLLAALVPALEATSAPPRATLSRAALEDRLRRVVPIAALMGAALLVLGGGALLLPSRSLLLAFVALFAVILGFALLSPGATVLLMTALQPVMRRLFGVLGGMSARGVVASLSRTAPAIAALVIAVSVTIALGVMIGSFRSTVERWLDHTLRADVYVSPPGLVSSRTDAVLDPSLIRLLSGAPGVAAVTTYRGVTVEGGSGPVQLVALELDPRTREAFSFRDGVAREVWRAWEAGNAVLVSESYAYRHDLRVGSALSLRTDAGPASFDVAGVFADYGNDQGVVMMPRAEYDRYWDDPAISSLGLFALPGTDVERLVQELRGVPGPGQEVLIRSNRTLREISLEVFDRTFAITAVLRLLAFVVAFIGVLSALMALQLERSRELGVMRANGLTPGQVWQLVTSQTGLIGLAAGLLSLPVGATIAAIMIHVVNRRAFGWTLQMEMPPALFGQAIGIALGAALLAGLYPAYRMARTSPARALREE